MNNVDLGEHNRQKSRFGLLLTLVKVFGFMLIFIASVIIIILGVSQNNNNLSNANRKLLSGGFLIFADVDGLEYAIDLEPDATVADVIFSLTLHHDPEGIIYAGRLLKPDVLLSDAVVCAQAKITLSPYTSVRDMMLSDFVATDDFYSKIRKMNDIFPVGSFWKFKG